VGHFEGLEQGAFGHFVHFAFHHHDVFFGGTHHDVHVGLFKLLEGGVDYVLAFDACHAYLRDGAVEGNVGAGQGSRCGKAGQSVGHVYAVGGEERDVDEDFGVVVGGEERAQGAVYKA
jgi:L-aminopeptidase/D-esterase-like protein